MSDNIQKNNIKKILKEMLRDYEDERTTYVKTLVSLEKDTASEERYKKREDNFEPLENHEKNRRKSKKARNVAFRISFTVCASVLVFIISGVLINPKGITAAIPSFIMKSFFTPEEGTTIQINPNVLADSSELNPYPELEFNYIPDGYELQKAESGDSNEYNFLEVNDACIRFIILLSDEDYSISYGSDVEFDESKVVYVGDEEIYRMKKSMQGNKVLYYLWTRDGYTLSVYSYKVEEDVIEKMIMMMSIK